MITSNRPAECVRGALCLPSSMSSLLKFLLLIFVHPDTLGLRLPGVPTPLPLLSLYADDTSVISSSDAGTVAVFDTYSKFERGTGAKLNSDKCEGLWLGSWKSRVDKPVPILWSSVKIKVLGVFLGNEDLNELNWRPRIEAVERCLDSWCSRHLSYKGKALVMNALALSRVWYVASLIPMPSWVLDERNSLVFNFFWSGKWDLVARNVLVHHRDAGGFSVVSVQFKVTSLLAQWVRRFVFSPNGWVFLLTYWFFDHFGVRPLDVFADPFAFSPEVLPPFYASLLKSWRALLGSSSSSGLVVGSSASAIIRADSLSTKSWYQLLLLLNPCRPHCIAKFYPRFGDLDWATTWKSLFFMPFDRHVIDLNWKVAHGVLYTADRLISFGYSISGACFCGSPLESPEHLFFSCPLAQSGIDWLQSLLFSFSPMAPSLELCHLLFGFNNEELLCVPRVFSYLLNVCKFFIWTQINDFRFRSIPPSTLKLLAAVKARARFYLPLFFQRFVSDRRKRYFFRQWGAYGVVGSLQQGVFKVCL